ncbi:MULTISPECIES: hypothetical protein [Flavobacterium]|uniref:Nitrogen regulatory IIA protein n=1 Tax=Flavobacterium ginsenosidimutans TaxID=687844 RepID=A0ABZ2Q499_9FLAO|nr:hypothetical protein [Flavobacterium sp. SH_e]MCV2484805.1 hypothetical protein [Flavobacterium sp. SH_e]
MKALFKRQTEPFAYHRHYLLAQKRWADEMQRLTGGLSRRQLVWALLLFTVLASGFLIYSLYRSFNKEAEASADLIDASKIKTINLKK